MVTNIDLYSDSDICRLRAMADVIELRIDYFQTINISDLKLFISKVDRPVIFTLRKLTQGGYYAGDESCQFRDIKRLLRLNPAYFDMDCDMTTEVVMRLKEDCLDTNFICSYHNYSVTPKNLDELLQTMLSPIFYAYKIAVFGENICDVIRMLLFVKQNSDDSRLTGICMGGYGQVSRILAPFVNSMFNYTYLDNEQVTAPGQIILTELSELYAYYDCHPNVKIVFVATNNGDESSRCFSRQYYVEHDEQIIYIRINPEQAMLATFCGFVKQLSVLGVNVSIA